MLTWIRGLWQGRAMDVPQIQDELPAIPVRIPARIPASKSQEIAVVSQAAPQPVASGRLHSRSDDANCPLRQAGLGNFKQRRRLRKLGLTTLAEIAACQANVWPEKHGLPTAYQRLLIRWQWAISASTKLPPMRPIDCLLAHAVHRRTIGAIARSVPVVLYRDIYRFSLSSAGAKLVGEHHLPNLHDIEAWVSVARQKYPLYHPSNHS
jgi:hypothetical protein